MALLCGIPRRLRTFFTKFASPGIPNWRRFGGEISIQIFVGNDGLTQTAEMRPTHLREDADWIYAADDCCGLRMRIARLTEIFFHGSSGSADWALRTFEPEGRLVCAITPPKGSDPGERRETRIKLEAAWEENAK